MAPIPPALAGDLLVADRLTNGVYRYSESGELLGTVLTDNANINQAVGIALSPDQTQLYVASAQNNRLMRYEYDCHTGVASAGVIFAEGPSDGLFFPNSILFSEDGDTIYVSNYAAPYVASFSLDGTPGAPLTGEIGVRPVPGESFNSVIAQFSGLAFAPDGRLLVGGWAGYPDASYGAIGVTNTSFTQIEDFTGDIDEISGASGLLIHDGYLYVSGMLSSQIRRFNLLDGSIDSNYLIDGLPFPQALVATPEGDGFLVGVLGSADGEGRIDRYLFDGTFVETIALPSAAGFAEATAFAFVRDPLYGDFNGDGLVDAADYTVWRDNYGTNFNLNGAGDETGASFQWVDEADYQLWKNNYGAGSQPARNQAVPEPQSALLIGLAAAASLLTRSQTDRASL